MRNHVARTGDGECVQGNCRIGAGEGGEEAEEDASSDGEESGDEEVVEADYEIVDEEK